LAWGEPALSILDVRNRDAFNYERITGAMPLLKIWYFKVEAVLIAAHKSLFTKAWPQKAK
jgi:hypothetical protein